MKYSVNRLSPEKRRRILQALVAFLTLPSYIRLYGIRSIIKPLTELKSGISTHCNNNSTDVISQLNKGIITRLFCLLPFLLALRILRSCSIREGIKHFFHAFWHGGLEAMQKYDSTNNGQIPLQDVVSEYSSITHYDNPISAVTVLVPVFNGIEHLRELFPSIIKRSPAETHFLLVDDASTEKATVDFLTDLCAQYANVECLHNSSNLGFVRSVNRGMDKVATDICVLANTDIRVPEDWLPRLVTPILKKSSIASVTPFTNAGVFFSFPQSGTDNTITSQFSLEEIDMAFQNINPSHEDNCRIHSGVGFCMAVNMACWKAIGPFDENAFGRGYGEESDWCMRADSHGWQNVLAPNLFVYHKHGGTFRSEEKQRLCDEHQLILRKRWPKQIRDMQKHVQNNPWAAYRMLASIRLAATGDKGCLLLLDYDGKGNGAYSYRIQKLREFTEQGWRVLLATYNGKSSVLKLECAFLHGDTTSIFTCADIPNLFSLVPISFVFINNIAFFPEPEHLIEALLKVKSLHNFRLEYALHDFLCCCPSFFLLDKYNRYCAGGSISTCRNCLAKNPNATLSRTDIDKWRTTWRSLLQSTNKIKAFSESSKNVLMAIHGPDLRVEVKEHQPVAPDIAGKWKKPNIITPPYAIAFIGHLVPCKGNNILFDMAELIEKRDIPLSIEVFGDERQNTTANIRYHGPYQVNNLPSLLQKHGILCVAFSSVWPETFSFVTQESMLMGLPIVCFDMGGPAERIKKYNYTQAEIVSKVSAEGFLDGICTLLKREYRIDLTAK